MKKQEHICTRMVKIIEGKGLSVAEWEEKASFSGVNVSGGYLRKSAKNDIAVGHKLIEYFLDQFQDVDANWLLTGNEDMKEAGNGIGWLQPLSILQKDMDRLRADAENLKQRIEVLENEGTVKVGKA